jgi:hypothetical protein
MTTESGTTQDAAPAEPTESVARWVDNGGGLAPGRDSALGSPPDAEPPAAEDTPAGADEDRRPLLSEEAEQRLLERWNEIQVGFVDDPLQSVLQADVFIQSVFDAQHARFAARRAELAAAWQSGESGTEELRLALRRYRSFVRVILPK